MIDESLATNKIRRTAFWLENSAGGQVFSWLHAPLDTQANRVGVLIIGPVGPEYMHSHRTIRFLADALAQCGFIALRYDPTGMGNSSGDLRDKHNAALWNATLTSVRDFFSDSLGISELSIISLRSGALIASDFLSKHPVAGAVFWYPYLNGSAFVRDMQIIDSMLQIGAVDSDLIEAGGYPLNTAAQDFFNSSNILQSTPRHIGRALVINNAAQPPSKKLQQSLSATGADVIQRDLSGLERMMKQAEITLVPRDNITLICEWFSQSFTEQQNNLLHNYTPGQDADGPVRICQVHTHSHYRESLLTIDLDRSMFAVLTEPVSLASATAKKPLVVFVNGGSGHHVGPNRLYVDICRALTLDGFSSVRLDLSNLGDSARDISPESHNPYALSAAGDIQAALGYLQKTRTDEAFILVGLCSGAHNSFHAALQMQTASIREIILINPLVFHWQEGDSLLAPRDSQHEADANHYQDNIRNWRKWLSLFSDIKKLRNAMVFVVRLVRKKIERLIKLAARSFGVAPLARLEQDILSINAAGTHITLLIGDSEPGYRVLLAQAGDTVKKQIAKGDMRIAIINDGDHTFSSRASRQDLLRLLVNELKKY